MKKPFFLLLPVLFLSGCVSISSPVMLDKAYPSAEKYEIIGEVVVEGTQYVIIGLVWLGGVEWTDLRNEAVRIHGRRQKVDDVVSVSVDTEVKSVLGIFTWQRITMRGTAIRYINSPAAP